MGRSNRWFRRYRPLFHSTLALSLPFVAGCGTFQTTPAQERVWAAEAVCKAEVPDFRVTRVAEDGRYYMLTNDAGSLPRAQQCMARELRRLRAEGK
jgi:hypothetical protein